MSVQTQMQVTRFRLVNDFVIERGIPVPGERDKSTHYPFSEMEPGESFLVSTGKMDNCRSAANQYRLRTDPKAKFTVRKVDKKNARCWRVT